jgi:hypothetical protein
LFKFNVPGADLEVLTIKIVFIKVCQRDDFLVFAPGEHHVAVFGWEELSSHLNGILGLSLHTTLGVDFVQADDSLKHHIILVDLSLLFLCLLLHHFGNLLVQLALDLLLCGNRGLFLLLINFEELIAVFSLLHHYVNLIIFVIPNRISRKLRTFLFLRFLVILSSKHVSHPLSVRFVDQVTSGINLLIKCLQS